MKIIQLPDVLHDYLIRTIEAHGARGIHPEEGLALNRLWDAIVNRVTTIPDAEIKKASAEAVAASSNGPDPLADSPLKATRPVECDICFADEGSYSCVRPSHAAHKAAGK
jgi:hypothetical protein